MREKKPRPYGRGVHVVEVWEMPGCIPQVFRGVADLVQLANVGFFPPSLTAIQTLSTSLATSLAGSISPAPVRFDDGAPPEVHTCDAVQAAIIPPKPILRPAVVLRVHQTGAVDRHFRHATTRKGATGGY